MPNASRNAREVVEPLLRNAEDVVDIFILSGYHSDVLMRNCIIEEATTIMLNKRLVRKSS